MKAITSKEIYVKHITLLNGEEINHCPGQYMYIDNFHYDVHPYCNHPLSVRKRNHNFISINTDDEKELKHFCHAFGIFLVTEYEHGVYKQEEDNQKNREHYGVFTVQDEEGQDLGVKIKTIYIDSKADLLIESDEDIPSAGRESVYPILVKKIEDHFLLKFGVKLYFAESMAREPEYN